MKYLFFISIILLSLNSAFGQHVNLPGSNAVWSVYNEKYFVDGDSAVNAKDYKKYYFSNDSIVTSGSFYALLREDTLTGKVFAISSGNTIEHLLYDFSLAINDTATVFPLSFPPWSGPVLIKVERIDSIQVSGKYQKRLKIRGVNQNTGMDEYWIEGIGSTFGIFNSGITGIIVPDIYYPTLLCFEKDGATVYHNPNFTDCYEKSPVGIEDIELASQVSIYPNPANSFIEIESDQEIRFYHLFSSNGKMMMDGNVGKKSFAIDLTGLPKGIYILNVRTAKSVVVKKIIKMGG
jgi:hypothetical protein